MDSEGHSPLDNMLRSIGGQTNVTKQTKGALTVYLPNDDLRNDNLRRPTSKASWSQARQQACHDSSAGAEPTSPEVLLTTVSHARNILIRAGHTASARNSTSRPSSRRCYD